MTSDWRSYLVRPIRDSKTFNKLKKDKEFLHWLGGFIDGEGNFCLTYIPKKYVYLMFTLANTDLEIMKHIHENMGLGKLYLYSGKKPGHKPFGRFQITRQKELEEFLSLIIPYLRVKNLDAKKMLDFLIKWKDAHDENARRQIKKDFELIE